jgi:NAD(P)-dependent dehydrogenase (short-subunit alcohol dehydrogenase family)
MASGQRGRLAGKVAIVTGAGTGIGRGIAEAFAREGAAVVAANRSAATGEETVRRIVEAEGKAVFQPTDVTREADCAAAVEQAVRQFGKLDVLVNNAGIFPRATLEETTAELWERILATNLRGPFFMCKHAVPELRRAGGGSIVNLGSTNVYCGLPNLFAYSCSKGGLLTLTRNLARALAPDRIRANLLNPGWVISEGELVVQAVEGHDAAWLEEAGRRQPLGRHQVPEDAAMAAVFLASDESSQVTGVELNCDAGRSMPGLGSPVATAATAASTGARG